MKVVVLAAGRGSRLQNITYDRPKALIDINGKSILQRQIECFEQADLSDLIVVTGYLSKKICDLGMKTVHNDDWKNTEILSSLLVVDEFLSSSDCIICYGDIIFELDVVKKLQSCDADFCVAYDRNWQNLWQKRFENPLDDAESFIIDGDENILDIGKKVKTVEEINGQYMGLIKSSPASWRKIKEYIRSIGDKETKLLQITQVLSKMLDSNLLEVRGVPVESLWMEIDNKDDIAIAEEIFV